MEMAIPPKSLSVPAVQAGSGPVKSAPLAAPPAPSAPASVATPTGHPLGTVLAQPAELLNATTEVIQRPSFLPPPAPAPTATIAALNFRRPAFVDPLGQAAEGLEPALNPFRIAAAAKVFGGILRIKEHVGLILNALQQTKLPPTLIGALHQPDGTAAVRVQVQFQPLSVGAPGSVITVLTKDDGGFIIAMPANATIPDAGLSLTVHGANANATVTVTPDQIAANGMIGVLILPQQISPLPVSILAALAAIAPSNANAPTPALPPPPASQPTVTIGEKGSVCVQSFAASKTIDRFPWGVFFRLVEPQMSIATETQLFPAGVAGRFSLVPIYLRRPLAGLAGVQTTFVDRVPIDQPLSVDGFRNQIAGIDSSGFFTGGETVPMAASLGLGYVLEMSQQWTFQGLGLGDLVYSLPLAPGEQQQLAIFERKDTSSVRESEFFSESEVMSQRAVSDTSTNATFNSAFNEAVNAGSHFDTSSSSWSVGGTIIIASAGGGGSSSSGNTNSWLQGQRDVAQQAAQTTHSSAENQASARRTAMRTGMRLATTSESMDVTTKTITNHNHTHALTMQYWEVHRIYDISTAIDGLTLTCLVPMQIVRFMPPGQPAMLADPSTLSSHAQILARYANILRHMDILEAAVPRRFRHGLHLLAQFASDPTAMVETSGSVAEDVIAFSLQGMFLSCETISVMAVTKRNTRVGPVQLSPSVAGQPAPIPQNFFLSRDALTAWLILERTNQTTLQGSLALPASLNRSDIIGFEISRQFNTVCVTLTTPAIQALNDFVFKMPTATPPTDLVTAAAVPPPVVTLYPNQLESLLGGPSVTSFKAAIEDLNASGQNTPKQNETYANDNLTGTVLPQPFPVPALQIAPVLRYRDILEIEKTAQHVVRNTTLYSKAVWMSMTAEERAILLDGYTIGVPSDGLADASQMIPLLNCVQNKVLGVFGNSLIMPFMIPQAVAEQMGIDPAQLQQALLAYQKDSFVPPHSTVALPTRGVLGEAVLGHCPSAEKIDLTRFWNWQDAPADTAPGIGMVQLPTTTPPLTTGVTAPNSLTNLPPLINNLITAPQPNTSLLQAMGQQAASQQDFSPAFTGQQQLANLMQNGQSLANQARADALKTSADLTSKAMDTIGSLVGKSMGASGGGSGSSAQSKPAQTPNANKGSGTDNKGATQDKGSGTLGPGDFPINNSPIDKVTPGGNIDFGDAATAAELLA